MLTLTQRFARTVPLEADYDRCLRTMGSYMDLVGSLSDVASVESYPDNIYRVILNKLGGNVGALNYGVHVAFDLQYEVLEDGVRAISLPRDPHDSWIGEGILLADYRSETQLAPATSGLQLQHEVELRVDLPLPGFLALVPQPLIQSVGDGIMRQKTASITDEMLDRLVRTLRA